MGRPYVVVCSYRLGERDGVSIEAAKWIQALGSLGCQVRTVAGAGHADLLVPGLRLDAAFGPAATELADAFEGADVVFVENLCSLPLNAAASAAVAEALRGRPAVFRHHDLALERTNFAHHGAPPDDPSWTHVCLSERARSLLRGAGIISTTCYNAFGESRGDRATARQTLGLAPHEPLVLQPTRAIERKNIPAGVRLSEVLGATYWLTGAAEEGYEPVLRHVLSGASTRVVWRSVEELGLTMQDAYAAADLVALPSTWEGFGNPLVEAAFAGRPAVVGSFAVADELQSMGFCFFGLEEVAPMRAFLVRPDKRLLASNRAVARKHFSLTLLPARLAALLRAVRPGITLQFP